MVLVNNFNPSKNLLKNIGSLNINTVFKHQYQLFCYIENNKNQHVIIADESLEKGHSLIEIFPNKYLLNDVTEQLHFDNFVNFGDNLWNMVFYSYSTIFIPVDRIELMVVINQTLIAKETFLGKLKS
jgi:hypothetical protein